MTQQQITDAREALKAADEHFQRLSQRYIPSEKNDLENEDVDAWRLVVRARKSIEHAAEGQPDEQREAR